MNKPLQILYLALLEDSETLSRCNTENVNRAYDRLYNSMVSKMSNDTANELCDMIGEYVAAVESAYFEVGFNTAIQLFMGSSAI